MAPTAATTTATSATRRIGRKKKYLATSGRNSGKQAGRNFIIPQNKKQRVASSSMDKQYRALFRWPQPCGNVQLAGSFNNWGDKIDMEKGDDGTFSIVLELPVGLHTFKYFVDDVSWKYNPESAFAPDEFGNLNNFIMIVAKDQVQTPLETMIRSDDESGLPTMNPVASVASKAVRLHPSSSNSSSPGLRPLSPKLVASPLLLTKKTFVVGTPPLVARKSSTHDDSEYGLNISDETSRAARSGSITRSKSAESLPKLDQPEIIDPKNLFSVPKLPQAVVREYSTNSVLLAARTQHFGGDLVTQEHQEREKLGGHRSFIATPANVGTDVRPQRNGKLMIVLVGLPGRGKTFIGHILARHLTWMGHTTQVFNTSEYRREYVGAGIKHDFWNPENTTDYQKRAEISKKCLSDALDALTSDACTCVVFDATNATLERRHYIREEVARRSRCEMLFIESICDDPELIAISINEIKLNSKDYEKNTLEEVIVDYNQRIGHYHSIYKPLADSEQCSFIKVIDVGRQMFCNQVFGYLQSRIMFLMANLQIRPRPIWLSRHGQSMYNTQGKIGGDSLLSPHGAQYAAQLDKFINAHYPEDTRLSVWTSTMARTGQTVERIAARGRTVVKWKQLDEIDAGICDGLTYPQVAERYPDEYLARKQNKLHYRYPRGESYQDVIHRLEPVITELMRLDRPVLIVAHQAILRVLYAYLTNKSPEECPTIDIPLHVVIQLTPKAYHCEEVWHHPM
ncbi:6-phosphofructo-2-kinase/fructose-2,6-biphosphatase [Achlya hypogyna]|uniref:6-phosphofructo-2-kinase/fructose-2, 6-biphosphatase n=1 Tax=Achlya hypogyna TaxID=1202772 RepID=A0A1V9YGX3_ACHHY|nr:6-phosphofructo-2-kinase/fructose-2,6-biphosphatase [Achlya hypogyna]